MTPSSRNHGLDTLRALAIVLVVLHHYVLFVSHDDTFGWVGSIGWVGVDLFFALSGYLIGNQIFAALRSEHGFSLSRFYARRFLRTLPNFYVVLALYYVWPAFRGDSALLHHAAREQRQSESVKLPPVEPHAHHAITDSSPQSSAASRAIR